MYLVMQLHLRDETTNLQLAPAVLQWACRASALERVRLFQALCLNSC